MKYPKPPLSFPDQAALLIRRGLEADRDELIERLESVNYYRLSAYWYGFKRDDDTFAPGTTLDQVWYRYVFDRQLRVLVMDAVERVEIAIRTQVVNRHTLQYGPFGYVDRANLPGLNLDAHRTLMDKLHKESRNSAENFVRHYFSKYTSETELPLWMACELMTFGVLFTLYRGTKTRIKKDVAREYGVHAPVLTSWLRALNQVRNICAHHARLWNREFGVKPLIPNPEANPDWYTPVPIQPDRIFGILTILHYLLRCVAPLSRWRNRLADLLERYPDIPLRSMGFPENWRDSPLWKSPANGETP